MPDKAKKRPSTKGRSPVKAERETTGKGKGLALLGKFFRPDSLKWLILVALSLIISISLFPNILSKPKIHRLGDVAEQDIKASHDFLIENKDLTEKKIMDAKESGAELLCVACPFCQLQFDRGQKMLLSKQNGKRPLPSILYTQFLGLSLGIDAESLGINQNELDLNEIRAFL